MHDVGTQIQSYIATRTRGQIATLKSAMDMKILFLLLAAYINVDLSDCHDIPEEWKIYIQQLIKK